MLIYAPLAVVVVLLGETHFGPEALVFMFGSGVLHLGYFVLLQRYAIGDLSLVFPSRAGHGTPARDSRRYRPARRAARGRRPAGHRPDHHRRLHADHGAGNARKAGWGKSVVYGLLTGAFIAAYTIWDKHAVSALLIPPLLQSWVTTLVTTGLLTPLAVRHRGKVLAMLASTQDRGARGAVRRSRISWSLRRLVFTPVSYVAPAREISILIGAAMGAPARGRGRPPASRRRHRYGARFRGAGAS